MMIILTSMWCRPGAAGLCWLRLLLDRMIDDEDLDLLQNKGGDDYIECLGLSSLNRAV